MNKYRVFILGENFLLDLGEGPRPMGFYTTRYVEAGNEEGAEQAAVEVVREDEHLCSLTLNEPDDSPMLYVQEIERVDSLQSVRGFTFFPMEDPSLDRGLS